MKNGTLYSATRSLEQRKALRDAYKLLAVFDHFVIVTSTSQEHLSEQGPDPDVCWAGGWLMADCLARFAIRRIEYRHKVKSEPQ